MAVLTKIETPLGTVIASCDGQSLTGLWFAGQKYECAFVENPVWDDSLPLWKNVKTALEDYFQGEDDVVRAVPIAFVGGTAFLKAVWDVLTEIPYQTVWTYKDVAERVSQKLGRKTSSRAVGTAIWKKPHQSICAVPPRRSNNRSINRLCRRRGAKTRTTNA